ncbi:MAG: DUF4390 domain-containing protein [Proteobacteria bacterium]|nr:DUF4390 domain-containing protein [Pseudomonadota bacterium]MBU1717349.1 DUF4390 domain-containing protein [Pseudomonadota bacterium]
MDYSQSEDSRRLRSVGASTKIKICRVLAVFCCGFLFLLATAGDLQAQSPIIKDLVVTNSAKDMMLYLLVEDGFVPEMENAIHNGLPATFTFYVELELVRAGWLDKEIVSLSFEHTLAYDNLKEEYLVRQTEKGDRTVVTRSLAEAKALMAEVNGLKICDLLELKPGVKYILRVKARLYEKTLPLYFHYIIPFWQFGDIETDWYNVELTY